MKTARLILPLAVLLSILPAASIRAQEAEALGINAVLHSPPSYLDSLVDGGPIFQGLHLLLVAAFLGALILPPRRTPWAWSLALALGPFAFGALATWVSAHHLAIFVTRSFMYEGDVYAEMAAVPRPIQVGFVLTVFALAYRIICHVASREAREPTSIPRGLVERLRALLPYWPLIVFGAGLLLRLGPSFYRAVSATIPDPASTPVSPLIKPESFLEIVSWFGMAILCAGVIIACLECLVRAIARLILPRK